MQHQSLKFLLAFKSHLKHHQMCYLCDGFGIIYVSWVQGCIKIDIILLPNHLNFSKKKLIMFANYIKIVIILS